MNEQELAHAIMDDDGAGSAIGAAITSIPAGQGTAEPKPFSAEFDRLYAEYLGAGAPGSWQVWLSGRQQDRHPDAYSYGEPWGPDDQHGDTWHILHDGMARAG